MKYVVFMFAYFLELTMMAGWRENNTREFQEIEKEITSCLVDLLRI